MGEKLSAIPQEDISAVQNPAELNSQPEQPEAKTENAEDIFDREAEEKLGKNPSEEEMSQFVEKWISSDRPIDVDLMISIIDFAEEDDTITKALEARIKTSDLLTNILDEESNNLSERGKTDLDFHIILNLINLAGDNKAAQAAKEKFIGGTIESLVNNFEKPNDNKEDHWAKENAFYELIEIANADKELLADKAGNEVIDTALGISEFIKQKGAEKLSYHEIGTIVRLLGDEEFKGVPLLEDGKPTECLQDAIFCSGYGDDSILFDERHRKAKEICNKKIKEMGQGFSAFTLLDGVATALLIGYDEDKIQEIVSNDTYGRDEILGIKNINRHTLHFPTIFKETILFTQLPENREVAQIAANSFKIEGLSYEETMDKAKHTKEISDIVTSIIGDKKDISKAEEAAIRQAYELNAEDAKELLERAKKMSLARKIYGGLDYATQLKIRDEEKDATYLDEYYGKTEDELVLKTGKIKIIIDNLATVGEAFEDDDEESSKSKKKVAEKLVERKSFYERPISKLEVSTFAEILSRANKSNSLEVRNISNQLFDIIADQKTDSEGEFTEKDRAAILEKFERIEKVFTENNLPTAAKYFLVFTIMHPADKYDTDFGQCEENMSPTLKTAEIGGAHGKYAIMLRDLIKSSIESNSRDMRRYLENAKKNQGIMDRITRGELSYDEIPDEQKAEFDKFIHHLETVYNQTQKGQESPIDTASEINKELLDSINEGLGATSRHTASDRMVRYFMFFNGIKSIDDALQKMDAARDRAETRNIETARKSQAEGKLPIRAGAMVKNVGGKFLDAILENGSNSKEFLGGSTDSDATPLDTDLTRVTHDHESITDCPEIETNPNGTYGYVWFIIDPTPETTRTTRDPYLPEDQVEEPDTQDSRVELFQTAVLDDSHYGIRTGFGSSHINAIVIEQSQTKVNADGKEELTVGEHLDRTCFRIVKNGYYIPVYDRRTGELIFTPEQYQSMKEQLSGNHEYETGDYEAASSEDFIKDADRISELSLITDSDGKDASKTIDADSNLEADKKITDAIIAAIQKRIQSELGLTLRGEISEDLTPGVIEYSNTGSTGRGTNVPGDGDFDFMFRIDREIYADKEKLAKVSAIIKSAIIKTAESGERQAGEQDIRTTNVTVEGLGRNVDIDISFMPRTDKIIYASERAVEDYLSNFSGERRDQVVRNIIAAKKLFKKHKCYKPRHAGNDPETGEPLAQGGMGGIGTENWILQHGGSITSAARSFLLAAGVIDQSGKRIPDAEPKPLSNFVKSYQLWDLGKNHMAEEKGKYPHDNFIANNLDEGGYTRIIEALTEFLNI